MTARIVLHGTQVTEIIYTEARQADVPTAMVANARIKADLGWMPKVRFKDGLAEIIAAHRAPAR